MRTSEMMPSKHLKKEDVPNPITVTIAGVEMQDIGQDDDKDRKAVMSFQGDELKPMVLNVTNITTLEMLYGDDSDQWVGKRIEVYSDLSIMYAGKRVGGIRVRAPGTNGVAERWPWQQVIAKCSAVGITEDDVKQALRGKGLTSYKAERDTPLIQGLIADASGGGSGDEEIPI